jgi:hypothetical protein
MCVDPDSDGTLEELLTKADQAMNDYKKQRTIAQRCAGFKNSQPV